MHYSPPNKILILSDSNVMAYTKTVKNKAEINYQYRFIVSITKLNMEVTFSEKELNKQLNSFFKII